MKEKADIILCSNHIFTGISKNIVSGAVLINKNKIQDIVNRQEMDEYIGPKTKVYEYDEELIMAGFSDSDIHYSYGMFRASDYMIDVRNTTSAEECASIVKSYADNHKKYKRYAGFGWNIEKWSHEKQAHKSILDNVVKDKPVYLAAFDLHTFWLNSKALEECGFDDNAEVTIGEIQKDSDGHITGIIKGMEAGRPIVEHMVEMTTERFQVLQKQFLTLLSAYGITSVADLSMNLLEDRNYQYLNEIDTLEKMGKLTARIHVYPSLGVNEDISVITKLRDKYHSPKFQITGLKHFIDGVTSNRTAYLLEPYSDAPTTNGKPVFEQHIYEERVAIANQAGFGVRLHALGDGAVRFGLDIFEHVKKIQPEGTCRNGLEYCENIHPDDMKRFRELDVIASVQPKFLPMDLEEKYVRIGEKRCRYQWPFRTLLDSKAPLAISTEYPVADMNPFDNIYAAVTRRYKNGKLSCNNEEEKITVEEVLYAYTYGSAYSNNRETELGTLEAGKLADIIVIDRNLCGCKEEDILDAKVVLTIMDGTVIYEV